MWRCQESRSRQEREAGGGWTPRYSWCHICDLQSVASLQAKSVLQRSRSVDVMRQVPGNGHTPGISTRAGRMVERPFVALHAGKVDLGVSGRLLSATPNSSNRT
jgi:hypothetical protein